MLVRAKILTVNTVSRRYRCAACHSLQFFAKIIYVSKRLEWAFSSVSSQPLLVTFFMVSWQSTGKPSSHQFTMKALVILSLLYWQTQRCTSYKFYTFFRDHSLETEWNTQQLVIINLHFYILTEIYRQPSKIENFNRLPTKKLNFNWQPTSGSPYSDPLLKCFIVGFVLLLFNIFLWLF